jgi:hypothetical protein
VLHADAGVCRFARPSIGAETDDCLGQANDYEPQLDDRSKDEVREADDEQVDLGQVEGDDNQVGE